MKKYMKSLFVFLFGFMVAWVVGYYFTSPKYDFVLPDQNVTIYAENDIVKNVPETFLEKYFSPWTSSNEIEVSVMTDFLKTLPNAEFYNGQGEKFNVEFYNELIKNSNFENYSKAFYNGIVIKQSDLRFLPTATHLYKHPSNSTFGFPFDRIAYSSLYPNTPVKILHTSLDGKFNLVQSYMEEIGWIDASSIRTINKDMMKQVMSNKFMVSTIEPLFGFDKTKFAVGTLFPIMNKSPVYATKKGWQQMDKTHLTPYPLQFSQKQISEIANVIKTPYAWGGINGTGRDCSQTLQDLFSVFGVHIPRNTKDQAETLRSIDVSKMTPIEKEQAIIKDGIPFETILYLKGHAMLYIGTNEMGKPLVYHSIWGYKDYTIFLKETRQVLGKTSVTDLDYHNTFAPPLLDRIEKILFVVD